MRFMYCILAAAAIMVAGFGCATQPNETNQADGPKHVVVENHPRINVYPGGVLSDDPSSVDLSGLTLTTEVNIDGETDQASNTNGGDPHNDVRPDVDLEAPLVP